jgi:hypothetical protein
MSASVVPREPLQIGGEAVRATGGAALGAKLGSHHLRPGACRVFEPMRPRP